MPADPHSALPTPSQMPIEPFDRTLATGDRQLFSQFLEPFISSLDGQPARVIMELADTLFAYYLADTLAYLIRMLPAPEKRSAAARLLAPRRQGVGQPIYAPTAELAGSKPQETLVQWGTQYKNVGGAWLLEARAIFQQLSTAQVLRANGLRLPADVLANARAPEELPDEAYLQVLITHHLPESAAWTDERFLERIISLRKAFEDHWIGFGRRIFLIHVPSQVEKLTLVYQREGFAVAESMLRMQLPAGIYRKRRMEALAIFQDIVAPQLLAHAVP